MKLLCFKKHVSCTLQGLPQICEILHILNDGSETVLVISLLTSCNCAGFFWIQKETAVQDIEGSGMLGLLQRIQIQEPCTPIEEFYILLWASSRNSKHIMCSSFFFCKNKTSSQIKLSCVTFWNSFLKVTRNSNSRLLKTTRWFSKAVCNCNIVLMTDPGWSFPSGRRKFYCWRKGKGWWGGRGWRRQSGCVVLLNAMSGITIKFSWYRTV